MSAVVRYPESSVAKLLGRWRWAIRGAKPWITVGVLEPLGLREYPVKITAEARSGSSAMRPLLVQEPNEWPIRTRDVGG